ncbi:TPA: CDP-glycerol glycerophosphotransferase family protein [Yersinia enterocolitica]|nr:CDP-glycerol glycerophosphotransferase family protein [Yersinia enterocolitica]
MKKIILSLLRFISLFFPKNNNKIVFRSFPDYSGNAMAIYEYLKDKDKDKDKLIWLTDNKYNKSNMRSVKLYTLTGLFNFFTAKYIITTHNELVSLTIKNQKYISLWHGMPLKKIGYLGMEYKKMKPMSAQRIATSELTRAIIAASFNEPANNVYITGQPVCDKLITPRNIANYFTIPSDIKKVVFYLPTFRQDFNETKIEGRVIHRDNIFRLDEFSHYEFIRNIKEKGIFLIVKLHPAEEYLLNNLELNENIVFVKSKDIDLYDVLSGCDALITDYSSVYIDYLVTDKPIAFIIPDKDEYILNRGGFTLEPFDEWTPGNKIKKVEEIYDFFDMLINEKDEFKSERHRVKKILHKYSDGNNSKRVADILIRD